DFALTADPAALTIAPGSQGGAAINIARTNLTEEIALALIGPPTGIVGSFNPVSTTGIASSFVVSVAAGFTPGVYPLTSRGAAFGVGERSTEIVVTVPPPSTVHAIEYFFCGDTAPVFFAFQDGNGPWQPVAASTARGATRFAFTLTAATGGVLLVSR